MVEPRLECPHGLPTCDGTVNPVSDYACASCWALRSSQLSEATAQLVRLGEIVAQRNAAERSLADVTRLLARIIAVDGGHGSAGFLAPAAYVAREEALGWIADVRPDWTAAQELREAMPETFPEQRETAQERRWAADRMEKIAELLRTILYWHDCADGRVDESWWEEARRLVGPEVPGRG